MLAPIAPSMLVPIPRDPGPLNDGEQDSSADRTATLPTGSALREGRRAPTSGRVQLSPQSAP